MPNFGIKVVGIGSCSGFSKEYFEYCFLNVFEFQGFIPKEILNEHFGLGSGVIVFLYEDEAELQTNGVIKCELDGFEMKSSEQYPLDIGEELTLSFGEYEFNLSIIAQT